MEGIMNNAKNSKNSDIIYKIVGIAMFAALAFVVSLVFRIPVSFLTFDAKDAIIAMAGFIFGPLSALITALLAATIELSISDTGIYGFIMNFASSATFSVVASLIYKYKRTFLGSILSFACATGVLVYVMLALNIFVTPFYMGAPRSAVIELIPTMLLPFNLAKALMNSAIAMLLYKPLITALRKAKLISAPSGKQTKFFNVYTALTAVVAIAALATSIVIFVILKK